LTAIAADNPQKRMCGTSLAHPRPMHALDFEGELLEANDRPTIPVPAPRESGVRLRVARVAAPPISVTVDLVVCDLSRDPRSEEYRPDVQDDGSAPQTERRPPSLSIVRALR
jgi:hypothetical protein